jgi:hypothetical protein
MTHTLMSSVTNEIHKKKEGIHDRLCGLVVRVPGYTTEMYCVSGLVQSEYIYIYIMKKKVDRLCGLVGTVPGCTTEMYCASCEVRTKFIYVMYKKVDRLCGLVVRVPGYTTEMYCGSCKVRTEFICYVEQSRPPLWSSGQSSWLHNGDVVCFL